MRAALHVTLTPIVFLFAAAILTAPVRNSLLTPLVGLGAVALGGLYGWRNRHR